MPWIFRTRDGYALTFPSTTSRITTLQDTTPLQETTMNAMNARQNLIESGYIVLCNAVPEAFVNNLRSVARYDNLSWSNGTWDGKSFDMYRIRALLPDALGRVLASTFSPHYSTFFPHSKAKEWSVLKTIADAADQPVRRDFPPPAAGTDAVDTSAVPAVLLLATQDDTVIQEFGWNRLVAVRSNARPIHLNKGDILMFRGDLMYAPVGYETNNICVHCYLDTPNYDRKHHDNEPQLVPMIDDVSAVDDMFCYVHNCTFVASGTTSLRKHLARFHSFFFSRSKP